MWSRRKGLQEMEISSEAHKGKEAWRTSRHKRTHARAHPGTRWRNQINSGRDEERDRPVGGQEDRQTAEQRREKQSRAGRQRHTGSPCDSHKGNLRDCYQKYDTKEYRQKKVPDPAVNSRRKRTPSARPYLSCTDR